MSRQIIPNLGQGRGLGAPNARAAENLAGFQMKIIAGDMGVRTAGMAEFGRSGGFIGSLVLRKSGVAVNAEHGAAHGAIVRGHVLADFPQLGADLTDEIQKRVADQLFIPFLIRVKPGPVIVFFSVPEETRKRLD